MTHPPAAREDEWTETLVLDPLGPVSFDRRSRREVEFVFREIFLDEDYRRPGLVLGPGQTIVDAGANIGLFTLWAHRACGGDADLWAFEPAPTAFRYLTMNLAAHGLAEHPRVHARPLGLGRLGGPRAATLTWYPALPANSTLHPEEKARELALHREAVLAEYRAANPGAPRFFAQELGRELDRMAEGVAVEVALAPLAELIAAQGIERIDLLKIDTEGAELDVLDGLDAESWPKVRQVVLETTGDARAEAARARLQAAGFARVDAASPPWAAGMGLENVVLWAVR